MKEFQWSAFIKKLGIGKFIGFWITIILTIGCIIWVIFDKGLSACCLLILESILIDNIKEFVNVLKKVNKEYTIDTK